jgi:hypothetical protein
VDKCGQALYGGAKWLICKEISCVACFLGSTGRSNTGLSQPALDNHVDNF